MILKQKDWDETRVFEITDNGLKVVTKSIFGELERVIAFESISNDFVKLKFNPVQWVIVFVMIFLLIISGLFLKLFGIEGEGKFYIRLIIFVLGGIPIMVFYGNNETVLSCYDEEGIEFYKNSPSKSEFDSFIEQLMKKRNEVLKEKYGFVSEFILYGEQLEKFNFLHALGIISFKELEELKTQLDLLADKGNDRFTFNPN